MSTKRIVFRRILALINIALIIAILLLGKREITGRKIREALDNIYVTLAEGDTEDAVTKDFIVTPKAKGLPIRWISSEKINIEVIGQDGRVTRTSDDVEVYLIVEVELGGQKDHRVFRLVIKAVEPVSIYNVTFYVNNTIYGDIQQIEKGKSALEPETPVLQGHTFVNWDKALTNIQADTDIHAVFSINKYQITFKVDGQPNKVVLILIKIILRNLLIQPN